MSSFDIFVDNGFVMVHQEYDAKYVIAGDTDSAYINLGDVFDRDADPEDVIEFADYIGKTTNDAFPSFMDAVFNVKSDRAKVIQTDREVVSDKSYYLAKKMYVMHVIDAEGVKVDKLKMMGVAIKKTDTPKIVQDFLRNMVELLMDRESYEVVRDYVQEFKDYFYKAPIEEIGIPLSVKSLRKYEVQYEKNGSLKGFPYHVRASIYYNDLCTINDTKIVSGDKVKLVYVKHPKYKYVAFPVDAEVLPDFMGDFNIDRDAQWNTVVKKVKIFLEPIGYDRSTRQKNHIKQFMTFKKGDE